MLHKVRLGHFTVDETGRKRAAFTEVIVDADSGDGAASTALAVHGPSLAKPAGVDYEMKVGVCGVDCPTAEERMAWESGRGLGVTVNDATGHGDEFQARVLHKVRLVDLHDRLQAAKNRADAAALAVKDAEEDALRVAYDLPTDRMAKARAAKAAKKAAAE